MVDEPPALEGRPNPGGASGSRDPAAPPPDDKDWTWVLDRPCPDCGFRADSLPRTQIGATAIRCADAIAAAALEPGGRARPEPHTWSRLEYACHARDVCAVFAIRLSLIIERDDPLFANWDQDATAIENRYWAQDPARVADELSAAARDIARRFDAVADDEWGRPGRRSNGSTFTVESIGRYFAHDLVHHAHDVGRPIGA